VLSRVDTHVGALRMLIASQVELGRLDAARDSASHLLRVSPGFRVSMIAQMIPHQPALIPRFAAALRRAGLPD